ncbi:MAG: tRNA (cytidine(34)-2'-O)-methyltransferase [Devosiaceae bacterium]
MVSLALFQPEIPANTGALMRLSACLDVPLHIIGPIAFSLDDKSLRRAGMDYRDKSQTHIHVNYDAFTESLAWNTARLVLMSTKATRSYLDFDFCHDDIIMMGQESAGAPDWLHQRADNRVTIPMAAQARSINMAMSASLALGEALRQTDSFPKLPADKGSE